MKKVCTQQSKKFIFHKAILTNVGNKESEYNTSLSVLYFFFSIPHNIVSNLHVKNFRFIKLVPGRIYTQVSLYQDFFLTV